jgi:hypothetical protein
MTSPEQIAFAITVGLFACGAIGLILQRMLPEKHTTGPSRDMVGAIVGLLTLLSALTLGLLIWTAYGVYAGQNAAIQTLAAKVLQLDLALADYGSDANQVRLQFRDMLGKTIDQVWGADMSSADFVAHNFEAALHDARPQQSLFRRLPRVPRAAPTSAGGDGERVRRAPSRRAARRGRNRRLNLPRDSKIFHRKFSGRCARGRGA